MKTLLIATLLFCWGAAQPLFSQVSFPSFLEGTWKVDNKEQYEEWGRTNENELKGLSYELKNGQKIVSEYLKLTKINDRIIYTALVVGQNNNQEVSFELTYQDSTYTFVNEEHDFPNYIRYTPITTNRLRITVEGKSGKISSFYANKIASKTSEANPKYDQELAKKLGADDYGMKSYIFVLLKTGENKTTDKQFINECFKGHMENINRLVKNGQLIVAGPFGKNENNLRGLFILNNVTSIDTAKHILENDPAIKNELLEASFYPWYGSAALAEYLPQVDKIWKKQH
ncbi:DUF6265 family protein [Sphingobacterium sp.]|uniref:DUF6265 family protein n=1 Tax=Sphingobacterium sp. TaxID=341027 RepID=UPI00289BDE0D|nr:DUF6265 family protein [Sphingobacterium sp.]